MGTVSDFFRLLGRFCVLLFVVCHTMCLCECFKPLWAVRRGQSPPFLYLLEPSQQKVPPQSIYCMRADLRRDVSTKIVIHHSMMPVSSSTYDCCTVQSGDAALSTQKLPRVASRGQFVG